MFAMCLALYHTNVYKSVMDMPVWDDYLATKALDPLRMERSGGRQPTMAAATAEAKLAETRSKAQNALHMATLILGQKNSQRRGRIILEIGSPLHSASSKELAGCSSEETTRLLFLSYSKSGYSYVLRKLFHTLTSNAALDQMFFFFECAYKDHYTSQFRQASSSSSASSAASPTIPLPQGRAVKPHGDDGDEFEMAALVRKLCNKTVMHRSMSMAHFVDIPLGAC